MTDIRRFFDETYKERVDTFGRKSELLVGFAQVERPESDQAKISEILKTMADCPIAITITFRDVDLMKYKESYLICQAGRLIRKTRGVERYCIVSDYSAVGRFHLHGAIRVKNCHVTEILRKKITKAFGFCKMKLIDNVEKWSNYCIEQYLDDGKRGVKISVKLLQYAKSE